MIMFGTRIGPTVRARKRKRELILVKEQTVNMSETIAKQSLNNRPGIPGFLALFKAQTYVSYYTLTLITAARRPGYNDGERRK